MSVYLYISVLIFCDNAMAKTTRERKMKIDLESLFPHVLLSLSLSWMMCFLQRHLSQEEGANHCTHLWH